MKELRTTFPRDGTLAEQIAVVLHYGVRAPSTHNTQPWLFDITENGIELYLDTTRRLTEADKTGRDAYISLGACFEHLSIAAQYFGMFESKEIASEMIAWKPVARLTVHRAVARDDAMLPMMVAIESRFNARGPFISKTIPKEVLDGIDALPHEASVTSRLLFDEDKMLYAELVARGMHAVHKDRDFRAELFRWMHHNYSARKDGIPGYTMLAPGPLSLILPSIIKNFNMGRVLAKLNTKSISSASAACVLSTREETSRAWFDTGIYFERLSLYLASKNIRTSIYVAAIEVPELRVELRERLRLPDLPQFAFTFGYPKIQLRQSPRIPPNERMKS